MSTLKLTKVKKSSIFCEDFENFSINNSIDFSEKKIAVIYAPNGVGKTSLANVFDREPDTELEGLYNDLTELRGERGIFHVIHDQNGRNIINGQTEDFILGDDIKHERELRKSIDDIFKPLKESILISRLREKFGITKSSSKLIDRLLDNKLKLYIKDLANSHNKGSNINLEDFINYISNLSHINQNLEEEKIRFLIDNSEGSGSIISRIEAISLDTFIKVEKIQEVEENSDAIVLLSKYSNKRICIVCDNYDIDSNELLDRKSGNKDAILNMLNDNIKAILENILTQLNGNDPFNIKTNITNAIQSGDITTIISLKAEISRCFTIYSNAINNMFLDALNETELISHWNEYHELLARQLIITDEDMQFIERMINDNLDKHIQLLRDRQSNEIKLLLNDEEFLGRDRRELNLSTGEQNFISLAFEFVKAKNIAKDIIVIDDPISSFDSIFKNKITFAIIKFLSMKNLIILTHNTDLIRLLDVQKQKCFQLYLFNNVSGETNGFIKVAEEEKEKVIYINKMLDFLRSDFSADILNEHLLLISLVPFMRGYAQLTGKINTKNELTKIMHGYSADTININNIYSNLFGSAIHFTGTYQLSVPDILMVDLDALNILDSERYQLLNRVLKHSLVYLYLRLSVEKVLVEKYGIDTRRYEQLGDIIMQAFRDPAQQNRRIYFMSRKTLLNEFNHFEGNMSIFQPAIDISDSNLQKERIGILRLLDEIRAE